MYSPSPSDDSVSQAANAEAVSDAPQVLVVDDNLSVTRALSAILKKAGYSPTSFNTGLAALKHIEQQPAPDAVILDVHLPDLSGLVLSQKMRTHLNDNIPIIILSGDVSMETINSLPHVGATYFFSKPVNPGQLLTRLKELLEAQRSA
jgi:CheY-like chemotaxis protein